MNARGTFPEIARWWRKRQSVAGRKSRALDYDSGSYSDSYSQEVDQQRSEKIETRSTNPRTLLLSVTRSKDGLAFVQERVRALRRELRGGDDAETRFLLAMYLEKLGDDNLEEALREADKALARMATSNGSSNGSSSGDGDGNGWAKSERARLCKACHALRVRRKALSDTTASGPLSPGCRNSVVARQSGIARCASVHGRKRPRQGEEALPPDRTGDGGDSSDDDGVVGKTPDTPPRFDPVDERDASTLTYKEFIQTYAVKGRPVVLKGGASLCFEGGRAWGRESLRKEAGDKIVPVRRWVPDSVSWARLEEAGQVPLTRLLGAPSPAASFSVPPCGTRSRDGRDTHHDEGRRRSEKKDPPTRESGSTGVGEKGKGEPLYLHDWSLPQNLGPDCSLLASTFQIPSFFAGDMLQRVAGRGLLYTESWPSLFIGPRGSKSDTHIDSFGSHFWMALLEGKKRWLLYPKNDAPLLYPVWPEGCHDPVFEADLETPDALRNPAALLARGFQCTLEAGDLLFVPAGCPHRVENLTDTLALSCNYVDATNIDASLGALGEQALTDPGAGALASALEDCDRSLAQLQGDVPWASLKSWPRGGETADWLPGGVVVAPPAL